MNTEDQRRDTVTGLRALADFLEAHPDLPVGLSVSASFYPSGTDEEDRAEVDRIAVILHAEPEANEAGTHYTVSRGFGGGVTYRAVAITRAEMAEWDACMAAFRSRSADPAVTP